LATKTAIQPESVFRSAARYAYSADALRSHFYAWVGAGYRPQVTRTGAESLPPQVVSFIVLDALATELFLKCLLQLDKGYRRPPKGHSLVEFFNRLSSQKKTAIRKAYEEYRQHYADRERAHREAVAQRRGKEFAEKLTNRDFDNVLGVSSDAFEKWRYHHEHEMRGGPIALNMIWLAVRTVLLADHPEWAKDVDFPNLVAEAVPVR
jgi:hypothetical protein